LIPLKAPPRVQLPLTSTYSPVLRRPGRKRRRPPPLPRSSWSTTSPPFSCTSLAATTREASAGEHAARSLGLVVLSRCRHGPGKGREGAPREEGPATGLLLAATSIFSTTGGETSAPGLACIFSRSGHSALAAVLPPPPASGDGVELRGRHTCVFGLLVGRRRPAAGAGSSARGHGGRPCLSTDGSADGEAAAPPVRPRP
jgi:hypothetical protein